ncbi:hypothetical protein [Haloarcula laminariae]|uniref:hypothetical protein n=1 Tax=Haloarcula laminariae TaxID=2961577 RepID=UPI0024076052|nr:hypothetical protein [Halomicroarcula sp. FL173]
MDSRCAAFEAFRRRGGRTTVTPFGCGSRRAKTAPPFGCGSRRRDREGYAVVRTYSLQPTH